MESHEEYEAERHQWQLAVGKFILEFGEIEWYVGQLLVHLPKTNQLPAEHTDFKKRASAAIKIIDSRLSSKPKIRKPLISALCDAMKLIDERNLVAHNPLHLMLYDSDDGVDLQLAISVARQPSRNVTRQQLSEWTACAVSIVETLDEGLRQAESFLDPPLTSAEFIVSDK